MHQTDAGQPHTQPQIHLVTTSEVSPKFGIVFRNYRH